MKHIYLNNNSTFKIIIEGSDCMDDIINKTLNPPSLHSEESKEKKIIEKTKNNIKKSIKITNPHELILQVAVLRQTRLL